MIKLPTPDYDHVFQNTGKLHASSFDEHDSYSSVYQPAEDTFLLLDAIELDWPFITEHLKPSVVVEVGCGSGVVGTCISKNLSLPVFTLSGDINPVACLCTHETFRRNNCRPGTFDIINGSLLSMFRPNITFDLMVFNPPYVPTADVKDPDFANHNDAAAAWSGGQCGRIVTEQFLKQAVPHLSTGSAIYVVILKENFPGNFANEEQHVSEYSVANCIEKLSRETKHENFSKLEITLILRKRLRNEHLAVIRLRYLCAAASEK